MKSFTISKPEPFQKCLQPHRRLIRTAKNPYSCKPQSLPVPQQHSLFTTCQALFLHACSCSPMQFKTTFDSITQTLTRITQLPTFEFTIQMLIHACQNQVQEMIYDIYGYCEKIMKWLMAMKKEKIKEVMERNKIESLVRFWRKNNWYFVGEWGEGCYRIFNTYLVACKDKGVRSRHKEICREFVKIVEFYIKRKPNQSFNSPKQQSQRIQFLQQLRQSPVFSYLPAPTRQSLQQTLTSIKTFTAKRQLSVCSAHTRSSHSSKRPTSILSSFRQNRHGSSMTLKIPSAQKRFSCQPQMFRNQDFKNLVNNFAKQRNSNIKEEESLRSSDPSESIMLEEWDNQQQTERMATSRPPEVMQSSKQFIFTGFYQFVRVNGVIQPLLVENIKLSSDETIIYFKIRCSKVNSVHQLALQSNELSKIKKKNEDVNEFVVQKIVKALFLSRSHVGYRIQLTGGSVKTCSRLTFNNNDKIGWVIINGSFNTYYFEQYIFSSKNQHYFKTVYDQTMSQILETTVCSKIPTNQTNSPSSPFNSSNTVPQIENSDTLAAIPGSFQMMNCSNRLARGIFRICSSRPAKIPKISTNLPIVTLSKQLKINKYLEKIREMFGISLKKGEQVTVQIDKVCCRALLLGVRDQKLHFVLQQVRAKIKKFILMLGHIEMKKILELEPYAPKYSFRDISSYIHRFHFVQTQTYSRIMLNNDQQTVLQKYIQKIGSTYLIVSFIFLRHFDKVTVRIYIPVQKITLECDIILHSILTGQQKIAVELFTLEEIAKLPILVQELKENLSFSYVGERLHIKVFDKEIEYMILVTARKICRENKQYHQSFYLKQKFISSPRGSLHNRSIEIRQMCLNSLTKDCRHNIGLFQALTNYYDTHLNRLLNPIKPKPMNSDLYRFCMGDLITLCREFEVQSPKPEKDKSFFFVHRRLHKLEYNKKEVEVQRFYPRTPVCRLKENQVTNKIPFFDKILKTNGPRISKRIEKSLNVAYPPLYIPRC